MKHKAIQQEAVRVVVSRGRIARRVKRLAGQIAELCEGREITILAVLTGAVVFLADLIRHLEIPVRIEVAQVRSYPGRATRAQAARFTLPLTAALAGRHVLIVDDILDSGKTLQALLAQVQAAGPASVRTCVLLRKNRPDLPDRPQPDLVGFDDLPNAFIVGYGLDYGNLYRNLPDLCVLDGPTGQETP